MTDQANHSVNDDFDARRSEDASDVGDGHPVDDGSAQVEIDVEEVGSEDISYESTEDADVHSTDERDAKIEELTQQLLRARADFDNFRRRTRQEKEELSQFATKKLLSDILPVVDNFDRALTALDQVDDVQLKTGIEMVYRQLEQILSQYGVTPMQTEGSAFDPSMHDAVMQEEADGQDAGVVLQELQKGYLLHGKVLRPAMVKVSV